MLIQLLLTLHIIAGFVALSAGPVAFAANKWGRVHKIAGLTFFFAMSGVYVTSLYLSWAKTLPFLFCIGQFSYFSVLSGYRSAGFFRGRATKWWDTAYSVYSLIIGLGMIATGAWSLQQGNTGMAILFAVFGTLCSFFALQFLMRLRNWPGGSRNWIKAHISGMIGGYTATVTAFVVTAVRPEPALLGWLGPSVVLPLLLTLIARRFMVKSGLNKKLNAAK